jgi:microcystin-dependent protein
MTTKSNLATIAYNSTGWDVPINSNTSATNNAFGGVLAVSITASDVTLTSDQAQNMALALSGTLTGNRTLFIPSGVSGFWMIANFTTGSYGITVSNVAGSAVAYVSQGCVATIISDGTNCYRVNDGANQPGMIVGFGGTVAPYGYLAADGSVKSQAAYPALYLAIGTTWNTGGEGAGNFRLPNGEGAFWRGSGNGLNPSARTVGSYEADDVKPHNHSITDPGHVHNLKALPRAMDGSSSEGDASVATFFTAVANYIANAVTGITIDNSTGTESRPKNYAVLWCIKT